MDVKTFLMMGRPGSGKGTQAKLLAEKIGGRVYSSGDRLREMAASGSYFGTRAREVMDAGDLMPEWVSMYLFEDMLVKLEPQDAVVFEGSGRKEREAHAFHDVSVWLSRPYKAVYLEADEATLKERLLKRHGIENRADDAAKAIALRFERFTEDTEKSLAYFRSEGTLVTVNGNQSIEAVHADVLKALNL